MSREVSEWFSRNTSESGDWPLSLIAEAKGDTTIAVVIPARNEIDTIFEVVTQIRLELSGIVDELIVMDSLSSDATALEGIKAGATVYSVADVRPDLGVRKGKGEALWKSQFVTNADLLVFIDADLTEWGPHFVTGLLGPLLTQQHVQLVRGFYDRIFDVGGVPTLEGGRVTELVARPWLAVHRPELADVVQPLAGEWAIRRSAFEKLCVPVGYGIELSTLLDVHAAYGVDAIAQVDLGRRAHRHQSLYDLAAMATEILAVAGRRITYLSGQLPDVVSNSESESEFVTLRRMGEDRTWIDRDIAVNERPPAEGIPR
jgi:glucosyl-3-phosphoglycerate synthase